MIATLIKFAKLVEAVKEKLGLSCESEDVHLTYQVLSWLTDDIHGNPPTTIESDGGVCGFFILCREIEHVNLCGTV